jgi:hypothetical protein
MDNHKTPEPCNLLPVHASAVNTKKGVIIFLGPSGTGKTSIVRLLEDYVKTLALDAVYLIPSDDTGLWQVAQGDGRAHGKALTWDETRNLQGFPLYAVVRLYQSSGVQLKRQPALKTCHYLTGAFFEISNQRDYPIEKKRCVFKRFAEIAKVVRGYTLDFNLSDQTSQICNATFGLW